MKQISFELVNYLDIDDNKMRVLSDAEPRAILASGLFAAIVLLLAHYAQRSYKWHRKYKLPPRVPGAPIFGNSFQVPKIQQGPWAKQLAAKYGEMYVIPPTRRRATAVLQC